MVALRNQKFPKRAELNGARYAHEVKAGVEIFAGSFVAVTAQLLAVPAGHADAVALIGLATERYKGGDRAESEKGCFCIPLPAATPANIGAPVYAVDSNTLALSGTGGKLKLGTIEAIDLDGVWIRV